MCTKGELHLLGSSRKEPMPRQEQVYNVCSAGRAKFSAACTGSSFCRGSHLEFYLFVIWYVVHAELFTVSKGSSRVWAVLPQSHSDGRSLFCSGSKKAISVVEAEGTFHLVRTTGKLAT